MRSFRHAVALLVLLPFAACVDGAPLMPVPVPPSTVAIPALQCVVEVRAETLSCAPPPAAQVRYAAAANRLVGGQDVHVKLASSGLTYDAGSEIFQINVTLQNLLRAPLGTSDGVTVNGVRVFFASGPTGTGGVVTVQNPSGTAFFTEADQPYFEYPQILDPYEISTSLPWRFSMPASVTRFTFEVYVSGPQADETQSLLDRVWTGASSTAWADGANWNGGVVPDSASTVAVPPDSLTASANNPVLAANAQLTHLRLGHASTLNLGGNVLTAWGNVDVTGTMSNGTLWMRGTNAVLRGAIPWLTVDGTVATQGTTTVTGTLLIVGGEAGGGTLIVNNYTPLTVINPTP